MVHDALQLLVSGRVVKSFLHGFLVELLEALHLAVGHHDDGIHDLLLVLAEKLEPQKEEESEVGEDVRIAALHQLDVVCSELKRSSFKVHVAGTAGEDEAEVDMNHVAMGVDEDVVVVAVLDLEEVLDEGVSCQ